MQAIGYGGAGAHLKAGVVVAKGHVQMLPLFAADASRLPSALEATDAQFLVVPTVVSSIQVAPLSVDFHMLLP